MNDSNRPGAGFPLPVIPWLLLWVLALLGSAARATGAEVHIDQWPAVAQAIHPDALVQHRVERLLQAMSLEEKIGQLIQADIDSVTPAEAAQYHLGSILAGGNAAPDRNIRSPASRWLDLTESFYRSSKGAASTGHEPIPVLFGVDAVHGHAKVPGATIFPHNVGLGATHDPALIESIGRATAAEVSATGIDWTFAPTVAVVRDVRWGRSYESYSEDPQLVAAYAQAMVSGLQGRIGTADFLSRGHTLASVKHFLGDGATVAGRDQFDSDVDEITLRDVHSAGYPAALTAGALIVMASYNGWHGTKMHANPELLEGLLKDHWNFPGFIVGDWNAQEEIPGCSKFSCSQALNAGVDMFMAPDSWRLLYANLITQVGNGTISPARIDAAVRRILTVKVLAGILEQSAPKVRFGTDPLAQLGSAGHRELARQAVRESLVLLKNNQHLLPLNPGSTYLIAGAGSDDIGMQSGGWTIDWQGNHNSNTDFPGATSIYSGLKTAIEAAGGHVITALGGLRPAAAIMVYGETPYAEFQGDRETLEFSPDDHTHLDQLERLRAAGIPVISIFLSGRPLWTNRELNASDAFVAAWLPGSEGSGIADLILKPRSGQPGYDFTGRLSFSWPMTAMPVVFDGGGHVSRVLFPRGYGLSLSQASELGPLSEDPAIPADFRGRDTLFHAHHVTAPWSIYVADTTAEVRLTMVSQTTPQNVVTARLLPDGLRTDWSGGAMGEFRIGGRPIDLTAADAGQRGLRLHYRVDTPPTETVYLRMRCEPSSSSQPETRSLITTHNCGPADEASVDMTAQFIASKPGVWRTVTVPVRCIRRRGTDLAQVESPLTLDTHGRFGLTLDEVRWVETAGDACPKMKDLR